MKQLIFLFFAIFLSKYTLAQSFPNLNASSGADFEFPMDADSNMYMFQGIRLSKVDKNFTAIWSNEYSNITFKTILLSKTGSIFFIGQNGNYNDIFGKLNSDGTLVWTKNGGLLSVFDGTNTVNYMFEGSSLLLDRNNDLVICGTLRDANNFPTRGFLLKADTSGSILKFKTISNSTPIWKTYILEDSVGTYLILTHKMGALSPMALYICRYNDATDSFVGSSSSFFSGVFYLNQAIFARRSKVGRFLILGLSGNRTNIPGYPQNPWGPRADLIMKVDYSGTIQWGKSIAISEPGATYYGSNYIPEDETGNVFYNFHSGNSPFTTAYTKITSNGIFYPISITMLRNYPASVIPANTFQVIKTGKYYFEAFGNGFPSDSLTIQLVDSTLMYNCADTLPITTNSENSSQSNITPTLDPVVSYTINAGNPVTVTPVSTGITTSYCSFVGIELRNEQDPGLIILPNPAQDELKVYFTDGRTAKVLTVFDLHGVAIIQVKNQNHLFIKQLEPGLYFLQIQNGQTTIQRRFIKE